MQAPRAYLLHQAIVHVLPMQLVAKQRPQTLLVSVTLRTGRPIALRAFPPRGQGADPPGSSARGIRGACAAASPTTRPPTQFGITDMLMEPGPPTGDTTWVPSGGSTTRGPRQIRASAVTASRARSLGVLDGSEHRQGGHGRIHLPIGLQATASRAMARLSNTPLATLFGQSHLFERFGFRISHVATPGSGQQRSAHRHSQWVEQRQAELHQTTMQLCVSIALGRPPRSVKKFMGSDQVPR